MIRFFLRKTDDFLCKNVKNIFEKTESAYKHKGLEVNLFEELQHLEFNPLICMLGKSSNFEKNIKIKLKMVLGIFFVAIPLFGFGLVTYILDVDYTYAFISTFVVAILVSSRMDNITSRYAHIRYLHAC